MLIRSTILEGIAMISKRSFCVRSAYMHRETIVEPLCKVQSSGAAVGIPILSLSWDASLQPPLQFRVNPMPSFYFCRSRTAHAAQRRIVTRCFGKGRDLAARSMQHAAEASPLLTCDSTSLEHRALMPRKKEDLHAGHAGSCSHQGISVW